MFVLAFDRGLFRLTVNAPHRPALLRFALTRASDDTKALRYIKLSKLKEAGACAAPDPANTVI